MYFQTSIVALILSLVFSTTIDYSWRNYNGEVPDDAVIAGLDKYRNPIYIGQALFLHAGILPGTLHQGSARLAATSAQSSLYTDKFVKILCSGHPRNIWWRHVNNYSEISLIPNVHLVEGGAESNSVIHIGRVQHEGSLEVGKIYNIAPYQGLYFPNREQTETGYQSFDVLVYTVTSTGDEGSVKLDVDKQKRPRNIHLYV